MYAREEARERKRKRKRLRMKKSTALVHVSLVQWLWKIWVKVKRVFLLEGTHSHTPTQTHTSKRVGHGHQRLGQRSVDQGSDKPANSIHLILQTLYVGKPHDLTQKLVIAGPSMTPALLDPSLVKAGTLLNPSLLSCPLPSSIVNYSWPLSHQHPCLDTFNI